MSELFLLALLTPGLSTVNKAKEEQAEKQRLRREIELQQLMEKEKAEKERKEREAFEKAAVEKWQREQAEKAAKAKKEKEEAERELRRQMRDRLLASGYHEDEIQAILDGKKPAPHMHMHAHPHPPPPPLHPHPRALPMVHPGHVHAGPSTEIATTKTTYTRMARKHLSIEALRERAIEFEVDMVCCCTNPTPSLSFPPLFFPFLYMYIKSARPADTALHPPPKKNPEFILIKRWVPPEEQKDLWSLTKIIRNDREKVTTTLAIEDRSHSRHRRHKSGDNLVLVRKTKRERSRSPSVNVLTYLAGGR